jgi:RNA polymerase sigma-70 factor (ECF subfamily)
MPDPADREPIPLEPHAIRARLRDVVQSGSVPPAAEPSDDELMEGVASGDLAALEQVYDRYSRLVFSVSVRVLNDRQLAEDVVQEVFLRLWRRPASYDPARGRFVSWLMSVTRNRALDEWRRFARRRRVEEQESDPAGSQLVAQDRADDPELGLALAELRRTVRMAMTRLPAAQRRVLELAYFGGLTQVEIAERTGDPLGTVKTRIRLGMRKLRDLLTDSHASTNESGRGDE